MHECDLLTLKNKTLKKMKKFVFIKNNHYIAGDFLLADAEKLFKE